MDFLRNEWDDIKRKAQSTWKTKRVSFITVHYTYLTGMSILGSVLLFPAGGIAYIDALFFATGSATQSGLNTVDLNKLSLYQQIVIYFIAMLTNPIVIHSTVVFVRLYWFEKRFQHVVQEAMSWRQSRSRSKFNPENGEKGLENGNQGIKGKSIVMLNDGKTLGHGNGGPLLVKSNERPEESSSSSENNYQDPLDHRETRQSDDFELPNANHREITFADEAVPKPMALSRRRDTENHIAFIENQNNPKDKGALRIPGPREFDRGHVPQAVDDDRSLDLLAPAISEDEANPKTGLVDENAEGSTGIDHGIGLRQGDRTKRNITFETLDKPGQRPLNTDQPKLTFRKSATSRSNAIRERDVELSSDRPRSRRGTISSITRSTSRENSNLMPYLSWQPTIGRNSAFINLTEEQREELGGIEYRSLKTLAVILIGYFFFWHILGVVVFTPWILMTDFWGSVVDADGVNRVWWGIFTPATLFNDLGFTLTPDSFISFQTAVMPLLLGSFLIVIGNTGFPCLLRFTIWLGGQCVRKDTPIWEEIRFLLDHPRRCFTLLFPGSATWVLVGILILLNGIDLIFFIVLDLNDPVVTDVSPGFRVLDGLFQATSTRTAGTADVNLSDLHPGIQVSYLIMMYISVFPIAISMRRTNVYEEKSLGVYDPGELDEEEGGRSYVGAHLRRQLSFDLWFIFLGLFIIAVAEGTRIQDPSDAAFTLFPCLFEIVSAYGTVGLSLGYPTINASFSAEFGVVSKLVILAMMIRGRHRGLPYELDRAILLPSDSMHAHEDDAASRRSRRQSVSSNVETPGGFSSAIGDMSPMSNAQAMRSAPVLNGDVWKGGHSPHSSNQSHQRPHPGHGLGRILSGMATVDSPIRADVI